MSDLVESKQAEENKDVSKMLEEAAENAAVQSEEEKQEHLKLVGKRSHESHVGEWKVKYILQQYKQKNIVLPLAQRLYVWDKKKREALLDSIERGFKCGSIELATRENDNNKTLYLCDGLQRIVSLSLLTNDPDLTEEQKKMILEYQIAVEITYELDDEEMDIWFFRLNSGVPVASVVKERAKLPVNLSNAVLRVSNNPFFREISDKASTTFRKSHHHEIIAENALLACAGVKVGSLKAKDLCNRIRDYEADITANVDKAVELVNKISSVYKNIKDEIVMRSMNANFVSVLCYAMVKENLTNEQIVNLIESIFAKRPPIKEYRFTTGTGSASEDSVQRRYEVLINLINNPIKTNDAAEEAKFQDFLKQSEGTVITTKNGNNGCDFAEFDKTEQHDLFLNQNNTEKWNEIVTKKYHELEKEEDIV